MTRSTIAFHVFPALILGLGWAVRGHFGHEWGAAWAGALGALAVVVVSRRSDWHANAPTLALLGAVGWAVGGMMSYGKVIGYCRGTDFFNVWYGYGMLAIIGGLYGCIGGGFVGLGLESSPEHKPKWAALLTEMVAGAYLVWGLFIYELEWFMTPPRSELWAACLGASAAMLWHFHRNGFHRAFRVAAYAALGAGFGFAFGNFLQTLGSASGLSYNWWNVMEFTLGFCGGLGMVYGINSNSWPENTPISHSGNWAALISIAVAIPLVNYFAGFSEEKLNRLATAMELASPESFISFQHVFAQSLILGFGVVMGVLWRRNLNRVQSSSLHLAGLLFSLSLYYILFSFILKGFFYEPVSLGNSLTLYIPILVLAFSIERSVGNTHFSMPTAGSPQKIEQKFALGVAGLFLVILIISYLSIHAHEGLGGAQVRF